MPHLTTYSFSFDNLNDNIPSTILRDRLKSLYPELNSIFLTQSNNNHSCLTISGTATNIINTRADILNLQPIEITLSIHSLYPGLAYRNIARSRLHEHLEQIAIKQRVQIIVDYDKLVIRLIGPVDKAEMSRIDVLVYFDQHLLNLHLSTLEIPLYALNILGNRRHANILSVMEETGTNIYLPSPWSKFNTMTRTTQPSTTDVAEFESIINVTGDTIEAVQRATTLLRKLLPQKLKSMCNSQSVLNPRKRDWLLLYKRQELTKIMRDNGSYISFSAFGSESINQIQVFAENMINVERTLRSLNYLTSHIFQAILYVNTVQSADVVARLSQDSGAEVIYRTDLNQFEITGSKQQIQSVVQIIRNLPLSQEHHTSVIFSIELALDQREFISGKKNGKINKIMKSCDADIQFQAFNDFNFIITIESEDFFKAKDGLDSLQNELPAEISFFVPEICHRRIIGVAGKNIQRVMKQYGVYVKFSSNDELATFGGYFENEHNVVARTPEKNIHSLQKLKTAVMEFITFQKDRDYVSRSEFVPVYAQRNLLFMNGKYLRDKGRLYNSRIIWPERNGSDHVFITGPQSHIEEMQLRVQSLLPQFIDIQVPASVVLENILDSPEIEELQDKIYSKTKIFLILPENLVMTTLTAPTATKEDYHQVDDSSLKISGRKNTLFSPNDCRIFSFKFSFDSNTKNNLAEARHLFDSFMGSRFVPVDDSLFNHTLNGSPSPEDIRHISPSVMHHIDHPESYEGSVHTNAMEQQQQRRNIFFQQQSEKPMMTNSASSTTSTALAKQHFLKRNYDQHGNNKVSPAKEDFNVWSDNPTSLETNDDIKFRSTYGKQYNGYRLPARPELKPNYSTSSANQNQRYPNNEFGSGQYYQFGNDNRRSSQQDFMIADPNSNPFAPIGYSRQRSTSLLPTIGSHRNQQQNNSMMNNHYNENTTKTNFGAYPLHIPSSSRVGIGSSAVNNQHPNYYMINSRLYSSVDRKTPSSSLSTPIPVAGSTNSLIHLNEQKFNFY